MLKSLIIISPKQFHSGIEAAFKRTNSDIQVYCCENLVDLMLINSEVLQESRLISFLNEFIIPPFVLEQLGYGGINFHPGPPSYPGHAPYSFAIEDGAKTHGVTAHEMLEKVDAGRIIAVEVFSIPPNCDYIQLIDLCIQVAAKLLQHLAPVLVGDKELHYTLDTWGKHKTTQSEYAQKRNEIKGLSEMEKMRRERAFGLPVNLH